MRLGSNKGHSFIASAIFRLALVSLPGFVSTHLGPKFLQSPALERLSSGQVVFWEALITVVLLVSLVGVFWPKALVKPLLGLGLFWLVSYQLRSFSYQGPLHGVVREAIFWSAGAACLYLALYDVIRFLSAAWARATQAISPKIVPHWAGEFKTTQEKGDALEAYVCDLYKKLYGNAMTTTEMKEKGLSPNEPGDQGADVLVTLPNKRRLAIQCKNTSSPMGNSAVQEIVGARAYYKADELAIVSPMGFTDRCKELAQAQSAFYGVKIELIDGLRLDELTRASKEIAA
jgi:hypothetical protein